MVVARAALRRWAQVKEAIDDAPLVSPGRYEGSTKVTPLLAVEIKTRSAVLTALEKIARLL